MKIDYSRDQLLTEFGRATLLDRYLLPGEDSPQDAFARAAKAFATNEAHAQRIYDYASKLWFMFSTPILSNGGTKRGLPISCYLNHVDDSRTGLLSHYTENGWLASMGGGIGGNWSSVRSDGSRTSSGGRSTGIIPFMHVVDSQMLAFSQGLTRRGSYAAYLEISHPEIEEFINMRKPSGGDVHRKCLNLHHGVNITNHFMLHVRHGLEWKLIDPHAREVIKTVDARTLWQTLLETRIATGEPYIHWVDTSNNAMPKSQKALGLKVTQSNLCSEIVLPTDNDRTAVCCLSSVNLEKYDEWKSDDRFISDIIEFLDNVITYFCDTAPDTLFRAVHSARSERSLGLGAMGFHSYLQKVGLPFEGPIAVGINKQMFAHIKGQAVEATKRLAVERGAPSDSDGSVRNLHLMAIAPNASSSIICGTTSPSIEPFRANAFTHKTMSGSFLVKNKYLEARLEVYGRNNDETWKSIVTNKGSVQHLDFMLPEDKKIFRTAIEIDQRWIVKHAADRQPYICQAQSVNLFFPADVDVKYLNEVHFQAWESDLKTLYYLRSETIQRAEVVDKKVELKKREDADECWSCQG